MRVERAEQRLSPEIPKVLPRAVGFTTGQDPKTEDLEQTGDRETNQFD